MYLCMYVHMYVCLYLSSCPSIYLFIYLATCPSVNLSIEVVKSFTCDDLSAVRTPYHVHL